KSDDGPTRKASLVDAPSAKLPPIDLVPIQIQGDDWDAVGRLAVEHAQRKLSNARERIALTVETAPDDPMAYGGIDPTVDWCVRRRGGSIHVLEWMKPLAGSVRRDQHMVDSRVWRKLR